MDLRTLVELNLSSREARTAAFPNWVRRCGRSWVQTHGAWRVIITVTRNEILYSFNMLDDFNLTMDEFLDTEKHRVHYLRRPFERSGVTTDFNGASVHFHFADLLVRAEEPR